MTARTYMCMRAVQCGAVWCGAARHGAARRSAARCGAVRSWVATCECECMSACIRPWERAC
eukprot:3610564-Alexandrium_andersonii.AAC.1